MVVVFQYLKGVYKQEIGILQSGSDQAVQRGVGVPSLEVPKAMDGALACLSCPYSTGLE